MAAHISLAWRSYRVFIAMYHTGSSMPCAAHAPISGVDPKNHPCPIPGTSAVKDLVVYSDASSGVGIGIFVQAFTCEWLAGFSLRSGKQSGVTLHGQRQSDLEYWPVA